jgi:hypothetical protein
MFSTTFCVLLILLELKEEASSQESLTNSENSSDQKLLTADTDVKLLEGSADQKPDMATDADNEVSASL